MLFNFGLSLADVFLLKYFRGDKNDIEKAFLREGGLVALGKGKDIFDFLLGYLVLAIALNELM